MHSLRACSSLLVMLLSASIVAGQEPAPIVVEAEPTAVEIGAPVPRQDEPPSRAAFGGSGMGGGPGSGGPPGYRAIWYPTRPTSPGGDLGLLRQQFALGLPVWKRDGEALLLNTALRYTDFDTGVILPDSGRPFPDELWNVSVGLMYVRQFGEGRSAGLSTTIGSASDKPFHSLREVQVGFFGFLERPARNERDAWLFSLMYQPTGNLNFPLPGVAYSWRPSDALNATLGIPFMVKAKPADGWNLSFSWFPVVNMNARAVYEWDDRLSAYGAFEWLNEAYFLADRINRRERFLVFEKRLVAGVRWTLARHAALDLNAGYAFDRTFGQGENTISNQHDVVDVEGGLFLGAGLMFKR